MTDITLANKFEGKWYGPQVTAAMESADETLKVYMDPYGQYWITATSPEEADKYLRAQFTQEGRVPQEYFQPHPEEDPTTSEDYQELDPRLEVSCWVSPDLDGKMKPDLEGYANVELVTLYAAEWAAAFGPGVMFGNEGY